MKKITTTVLAVVFTSSITLVDAQVKKDSVKTTDIKEVVVTALGIKREKKSLGYASQEIKSDIISGGTTNTGNIASQLSGKVAGLNVTTSSNFGGSANLVIRGVKSIGGSNPLIVIDGSPVDNSVINDRGADLPIGKDKSYVDYGNALSDINQEDIESINVLKGAAASALYGERGLNGVILIVTKNGRGKEDGSWGVTYSSNVQTGFIDKATFPSYQKEYGAGYDPSFYVEDPALDGYNYANFSEDASWGPKFDPNLLVYQWDSFDPTSPNYQKPTPWVAAKNDPSKFFNTETTFTNSVSLQKGDKNKNFLFTYDNRTSDGILPNSRLTKNTFSLKVNYDFTEKLHGSFYSTLNLQDTRGRNIVEYSDNTITGFRQWWQTNVDLYAQRDSYFNNIKNPSEANNYGNVTWNRYNSENGKPIFWNNPYFVAYQNYTSDRRFRSFNIVTLNYNLSNNLDITAKVSYDRSNLGIERRLAVGSAPQRFGASDKDVASGYSRRDITKTETNWEMLLNYKFDLTNDINVSGVVGGIIRRNYYNSIYASTEGGLIVPGIYSLSNSAATPLAPAEKVYITQTNSGYATASFDFYKLFYLDGTWRIDESSTLPKGNNIYNYPSITGSLILSEIIKADWLNFWKLRGNYAEVGTTADPYKLVNYYTLRGYFGNTAIYNSQTILPNAKLKPQRAKEFEVGTEMHFFKQRITLDFAYYKTKTINQILTLPISSASGLRYANVNAGRIDNSGYEVQLGLVPIKTHNFTWNIDTNWSTNKNKVVSLLRNDVTNVSNVLLKTFQGGVSINAREGETWGTLVGSDYQYLNGQPVINPNTGRYLTNDNQVIGNATPKWIGGIRNSLSYKGISLSFLVDVRYGGDIFSTDMYYGLATGLYPETAANGIRENGIVWPGVNPNGSVNTTSTKDPSAYGSLDGYVNMPAKRFVYDGSFVKLREASVGYTLPKSLLHNTFINDAKVSIVGRNLWIIYKNLPYADPESMVGGGINSYGWSVGSLPTTREVGINVTLKF